MKVEMCKRDHLNILPMGGRIETRPGKADHDQNRSQPNPEHGSPDRDKHDGFPNTMSSSIEHSSSLPGVQKSVLAGRGVLPKV